VLLLLPLLACSPDKPTPLPGVDTALPSPLTTPSGSTPGTTDTADWFDENGWYVGPAVIDLVHQSCENDEWAYVVEARGVSGHLKVQQWILGIPPADRPGDAGDYAGRHDIDGGGAVERSPVAWVNWQRWVYDWSGPSPLDNRPSCADDVGSDRIVVSLHLEGERPWNDGVDLCVMFGPDAENLRADPDHYRAYESGRYGAADWYDYASCQIIPWPTEPTQP
jgi:hypothetical protein